MPENVNPVNPVVTAKLIATTNTVNGFAIGILRSDSGWYRVVRIDPDSRCVTLYMCGDEADARAAADREWLSDVGQA